MTAVDTNVVVRFLVGDHPDQHAQAVALFASTVCYVPGSVILETAWVLGSVYAYTRDDIHAALTKLLGLPDVRVADAPRLQQALAWYADGLDFADAMHLASAQHLTGFATFDQRFIKRAAGKGSGAVREPRASARR